MARRIVVGDIHGCADELSDLMDRVGLESKDMVIAVGDAFDRGPKPVPDGMAFPVLWHPVVC
ncbi:MAG: metallophosphoesterase [Thermoanaerobaculales bacterium]|nr:metallophosphoesterase [Thermoanaerobaculales bacterium]